MRPGRRGSEHGSGAAVAWHARVGATHPGWLVPTRPPLFWALWFPVGAFHPASYALALARYSLPRAPWACTRAWLSSP